MSFVFLLRRHKIIGNRMRRLAIVEFMIMISRFNFFAAIKVGISNETCLDVCVCVRDFECFVMHVVAATGV